MAKITHFLTTFSALFLTLIFIIYTSINSKNGKKGCPKSGPKMAENGNFYKTLIFEDGSKLDIFTLFLVIFDPFFKIALAKHEEF